MRILVTGSSGFIGFHLAKSLLEKGNEVIGVDFEDDYYDVSLKLHRRSILTEFINFQFEKIDISNYKALNAIFKNDNIDVVVNLAAQAGVRYSIEKPHVYESSNILGFLNILECCRHHNIKKLIYASSSSVYGGHKLPVDGYNEKMVVDSPVSLYAASKKSNELMAHCYSHLYDIETVGLRFFTVYGPCGRPDMMMWLFADAMIDGKEINVFNNGNMRRDFTYIEDIVSGIESCVNLEMPEKYNVFNLGNSKSEELEHVISLLEKHLGVKSKKNYMGMQPGDVKETLADLELSKRILGFDPKTNLNDGISKFIDWFKEWKKI